MKVSIITISYNSEKTIINTLNSILTQSYKNIEHILVDGGSTDSTLKILKKYPFKNKKIICKKTNIYEAMNLGIKNATGDLIGILNSDDFYNNSDVIKKIVKKVRRSKAAIFLGDIVYFNGKNYNKITRYYSAKNFNKKNFKYGLMPPHPGSFIKKEIYEKYGFYKENLLIASDFEIFIRFILKNKVQIKILNELVARMRTGGISGKNIKAYLISTFEIMRSLKINDVNSSLFNSLIRLPVKLLQFFFYDSNKLNKKFFIEKHKFYKKNLSSDFKIIQNIKNIDFNKNFILSAMNLAFLGYLIKGDIKKHSNLINWPDGLFSKIFGLNIKKTPGREVLTSLNIQKSKINEIVVLGNLGENQKLYLKNIYRKKIINIKLPYGSFNKIKKYLKLKLRNDQLCFVTLPTPKQEQIAYYLANNNNKFKIVCIGASINIASGMEKPVPKILSNLEFLWRLRYETYRRSKRLFETFFYFLYGMFISNKIKNLNVEIKK